MDKRGLFDLALNLPFFLARLLAMIFIGFTVLLVLGQHANPVVDTSKTEADLLLSRLLFSPDCLAYSDGTRVHPGIIDATKLADANILKRCGAQRDISVTFLAPDQKPVDYSIRPYVFQLTINGKTYNSDETLYKSLVTSCFSPKYYCPEREISLLLASPDRSLKPVVVRATAVIRA